MLQHLEKLLLEREITSFDAKDNRIMCFPHTINIAVQHVLKKMSSVEAPEDDNEENFEYMIGAADEDDGRGFGQTFEAACAQDPIARLRKIVMTIRSSGQRRMAFISWIETGNKNGLFVLQNESIHIPPKQLLRDVRTRWDSTYHMLQRCIEMRVVSSFIPFHNFFQLYDHIIYFRPSTPFLNVQEVISRTLR